MTGLRSSKHLDVGQSLLASLVPSDERTSLNLSRTSFVHPGGLVALICLASAAHATGRTVVFTPPPYNTNVSGYLYRMRLQDHLEELGIEPNLRAVQSHDTGNRLHELKSFSSTSEINEMANQVFELALESGISASASASLYTVVQEAAGNVVEHSNPWGSPLGYMALQSYPKSGRVEFAIGDPGVGLKASLSSAYEVADDRTGIELAMQHGVSGTGRVGRGRGLAVMRETAGVGFSLASGCSCFVRSTARETWMATLPDRTLPGVIVTGSFLTYPEDV